MNPGIISAFIGKSFLIMATTMAVILFPLISFSQELQPIPAVDQYGNKMKERTFNVTSFHPYSIQAREASGYSSATPTEYKNHPEYGKVAFNSGIMDGYELIHLRTEDTRTFVKEGTGGEDQYIQKGYYPLHMKPSHAETVWPISKPE